MDEKTDFDSIWRKRERSKKKKIKDRAKAKSVTWWLWRSEPQCGAARIHRDPPPREQRAERGLLSTLQGACLSLSLLHKWVFQWGSLGWPTFQTKPNEHVYAAWHPLPNGWGRDSGSRRDKKGMQLRIRPSVSSHQIPTFTKETATT